MDARVRHEHDNSKVKIFTFHAAKCFKNRDCTFRVSSIVRHPANMHTLSQRIVTEARSWIGTRFAHQGRRKRTEGGLGGVDCLGLLVGVAQALELRDKTGKLLHLADETDYSRLPDGDRLREVLAARLHQKPLGEAQPGDIALFCLDGNPQHLAILSDYPVGLVSGNKPLGLIHAYAPARKVVEHRLDGEWQQKLYTVYRLVRFHEL